MFLSPPLCVEGGGEINREDLRALRAIGRRVKKLGYNWKDEGVGKIARIVLKLFATEASGRITGGNAWI